MEAAGQAAAVSRSFGNSAGAGRLTPGSTASASASAARASGVGAARRPAGQDAGHEPTTHDGFLVLIIYFLILLTKKLGYWFQTSIRVRELVRHTTIYISFDFLKS